MHPYKASPPSLASGECKLLGSLWLPGGMLYYTIRLFTVARVHLIAYTRQRRAKEGWVS